VQCLWRLYEYTRNPLFRRLCERVLQGIFWTQVTEGNLMGATHERIADLWLARDDCGEPAFDSMGTIYMGEQSLDCMLQLVDLWRSSRELYTGADLTQKIYPDGLCYYSADIRGRPKAGLLVTPCAGIIQVTVAERSADGTGRWTVLVEEPTTVRHLVWGIEPGCWYEVRQDGTPLGRFQADQEGKLSFAVSIEGGDTHVFEVVR